MALSISTEGRIVRCCSRPTPVTEFGTDSPKLDWQTGQPLWEVNAVIIDLADPLMITVKVPGQPDGVDPDTLIVFENLSVIPWSMNDRSGISYRATAVRPVNASRGERK